MKKFNRLIIVFLSAILLSSSAIQVINVKACEVAPEELSFTPTVFGQITSETRKVVVCSYGDENVPVTLKVSNGSQTLFKKTYKTTAVRVIDIPKQKAGTCLQFTLETSYGKKGKTIKKIVKNAGTVSKKKISSSLTNPKISGKITDKSTNVKVYAEKGMTLYIKHGSKVLAKKKYEKSGYQSIPIKEQKSGEVLTFFTENRKGRSKYVEKEVADVTAPLKPKVEVKDYDIKVTGEIGTGVYVKDLTEGSVHRSWIYMDVLEKKTQLITLYFKPNNVWHHGLYQVRLVDAWGNKSKTVTVRIPIEEDSESMEQ